MRRRGFSLGQISEPFSLGDVTSHPPDSHLVTEYPDVRTVFRLFDASAGLGAWHFIVGRNVAPPKVSMSCSSVIAFARNASFALLRGH